MNYSTGVCEKCGEIYHYVLSWGYERNEGLEDCDGKLLCGACRHEHDIKTNDSKHKESLNQNVELERL